MSRLNFWEFLNSVFVRSFSLSEFSPFSFSLSNSYGKVQHTLISFECIRWRLIGRRKQQQSQSITPNNTTRSMAAIWIWNRVDHKRDGRTKMWRKIKINKRSENTLSKYAKLQKKKVVGFSQNMVSPAKPKRKIPRKERDGRYSCLFIYSGIHLATRRWFFFSPI